MQTVIYQYTSRRQSFGHPSEREYQEESFGRWQGYPIPINNLTFGLGFDLGPFGVVMPYEMAKF